MKIYLVTEAQHIDQGDSLNKMGVKNRLISYYSLRNRRPDLIKDYVTRGHGRKIDEEKEKIQKMNFKEFCQYMCKGDDSE